MKPQNYPETPKYLWDIFYDFTQTPRPSKQEEKIRNYLISLAEKAKLRYVSDSANNIIIYVPGKNGRENDAPLIIQNHIDMVTDAIRGHQIDFSNDPLALKIEDGWLGAIGTTLGADNGIGCAAALATILDESLVHPPLELLFTVDEETGLNGALGLEAKYLTGKKMLNLDTEEWGSLYIGCAGGIDYELSKSFVKKAPSTELQSYKIQVDGFAGGHSGVDIHEQRGNAIKFLVELLGEMNQNLEFELAELRGGRAHNIIPRDAFAIVYIKPADKDKLLELMSSLECSWKSFSVKLDQGFETKLEVEEGSFDVFLASDLKSILSTLHLIPHGAHSYDTNDKSIVATSNNLARVLIVRDKFYIQTSLRFFDREEIKKLERKLHCLASTFELEITAHSEYPSWKPVRENPVLESVKACYEELYKSTPKVTAIHAGLECGILRDKIGPLDVVSFGPTITGAHSPDERVHIQSVEAFWSLFKLVLKKI